MPFYLLLVTNYGSHFIQKQWPSYQSRPRPLVVSGSFTKPCEKDIVTFILMTSVEQTPHSSTIDETFLDTYFPRKNYGIHFWALLEFIMLHTKEVASIFKRQIKEMKNKTLHHHHKAWHRQGLYLENLLYLGFDCIHIPFVIT